MAEAFPKETKSKLRLRMVTMNIGQTTQKEKKADEQSEYVDKAATAAVGATKPTSEKELPDEVESRKGRETKGTEDSKLQKQSKTKPPDKSQPGKEGPTKVTKDVKPKKESKPKIAKEPTSGMESTDGTPVQSGPDKPKNLSDKDGARKRQGLVSAHWNEVKPDIVFAQEIGAPLKTDKGEIKNKEDMKKWKLDIPDNYVLLSGESGEAGIAYNSDVFEELINIDQFEKEKIDKDMKIDRLWAAVLKRKRTQFSLLCVSWHGENAITGLNRSDYCKEMISYVKKIQKHYCKRFEFGAIVIGGDFNLDITQFRTQIKGKQRDGFKLLPPQFDKDGKVIDPEKKCIDYFMYIGSCTFPTVQDPKVVQGSYGEDNIAGESGYLHHAPVRADFCLDVDLTAAPLVASKSRHCMICDPKKNSATHWCKKCDAFFCMPCCQKLHYRLKNLKNHEPKELPLSDVDIEP